jgi:hypothetical protein
VLGYIKLKNFVFWLSQIDCFCFSSSVCSSCQQGASRRRPGVKQEFVFFWSEFLAKFFENFFFTVFFGFQFYVVVVPVIC